MEATALDRFRFPVRFQDGVTGVVDMSEMLQSSRVGVFARFADPGLFAQLFVERRVVTWPGELDLAPDAMYREVKRRGEWKL